MCFLPDRKNISCGRLHSTLLDAEGYSWTLLSWGRPFRLVSPLLDCSTPDSTPSQVECGWSFSAILTQAGDVFVFWPFHSTTGPAGPTMGRVIVQKNHTMDEERDKQAHLTVNGIIPCVTWDLEMDPTRLPVLPNLPVLLNESKEMDEHTRLIKIAGLDNCIVGLTNKGHVLKFDNLRDENSVSRGNWEYVSIFVDLSNGCLRIGFSYPCSVKLKKSGSTRHLLRKRIIRLLKHPRRCRSLT